jgi:hypothetical protein
MLTLAAREADIIQVGPPTEEKMAWVREAAGERFEHLEFSQSLFGLQVTDAPVAVTQGFQGMPAEPRPMTTEQAVEHLLEKREHLSISYIIVNESQMENFVPVLERLNGK